MTSGLINYDYASIADGVSAMKRVNESIREQVTQLKADVAGLGPGFTGQASQAYQQCAADIDKELTKSNTQLDTLSAGVSRGSDNMQSSDQQQARGFGR